MVYIQRNDGHELETVSQCEHRKEAKHELREWRLCDPYATYYLSSRCCKAWRS